MSDVKSAYIIESFKLKSLMLKKKMVIYFKND